MDTLQAQRAEYGYDQLVADFPSRVIMALDHLISDERAGVAAAVRAFARHETEGAPIPGSRSRYVLHAAPQVRVIVRRVADAPVDVEDIVRPATLKTFADAP